VASVWTGLVHLVLGVLGTFVLKRFPTSFSVGFFLGVLVVLANQNLILFGTFHGYGFGNPATNHAFANVAATLFCILAFFCLLLFHFKKYIVLAPIDVKGTGGAGTNPPNRSPVVAMNGGTEPSGADYRQYEDQNA